MSSALTLNDFAPTWELITRQLSIGGENGRFTSVTISTQAIEVRFLIDEQDVGRFANLLLQASNALVGRCDIDVLSKPSD